MKRWFDQIDNISAFLGFGYIPQPSVLPIRKIIDAKQKKLELPIKEEEIIRLGAKILDETTTILINRLPKNVKHIIPLSGGLDSRTILGCLLKQLDPSQIITITFGVPGSRDYEIGRTVALKVGTNHVQVDLSPDVFLWTEEELLRDIETYERPTVLFRGFNVYNRVIPQLNLGGNWVCWSGYMGDALSGAHLPVTGSRSWEKALEFFVERNFKKRCLTLSNFNPVDVLPPKPIVANSILSYDEQLDFFVRQPFHIFNSAFFDKRVVGIFSEEPYLSFALHLKPEQKYNQRLYKKTINKAFPQLFSIPSQSTAGLLSTSCNCIVYIKKISDKFTHKVFGALNRNRVQPNIQFFDWNVELRRSRSLSLLVRKLLEDLDRRNLVTWVDIGSIFDKHLSGKDLGEEIRRLVSLELFLKKED